MVTGSIDRLKYTAHHMAKEVNECGQAERKWNSIVLFLTCENDRYRLMIMRQYQAIPIEDFETLKKAFNECGELIPYVEPAFDLLPGWHYAGFFCRPLEEIDIELDQLRQAENIRNKAVLEPNNSLMEWKNQ